MNILTWQDDSFLVVAPVGPRLDALHVLDFKEEMRKVLTDSSAPILLDLGQVNFLDSSGLGAVVGITKMLKEGQTLEVANVTPMVNKVFRLTHMNKVFKIHKSWPTKTRNAS